MFILCFASTKFISTRMRSKTKQFCFYLAILFEQVQILSKKAKTSVYYCGLFLDSILSKSAGILICCIDYSQGCYSHIILTLMTFKNNGSLNIVIQNYESFTLQICTRTSKQVFFVNTASFFALVLFVLFLPLIVSNLR